MPKNTITESGKSGIEVINASMNDIIQNIIERNMSHGVSIADTTPNARADGNVLQENTIQENGKDGVFIGTNRNEVSTNEISLNSGNGISVRGEDTMINGNSFVGNLYSGVSLSSAVGTTIIGNTIIGHNKTTGISVLSGSRSTDIGSNTIQDNRDGIWVRSAFDTVIQNNTVVQNENGIKVLYNSVETQLLDNTVEYNRVVGIFLGDGLTELTREILFDQQALEALPPEQTVIEGGRSCDNGQLDISCYAQIQTKSVDAVIGNIGNCEVGAPLELETIPC